MPLYEFICEECPADFEELMHGSEEIPSCPHCGSKHASRLISAPGPLAKGAFPFKISPPRPGLRNQCSGMGCGVKHNS